MWEEWERTEALRADVVLDAFVVMPDHVHGIICIVPEGVTEVSPRGHRWSPLVPVHIRQNGTHPHAPNPDGIRTSTSLSARSRSIRAERYDPERDGVAYRPPRSLSSIVSGFKGAVTRRVRSECDAAPDDRVWHRNFHEHVLRDERHWRTVRRYIRLNPQRWWQKHGHPSRNNG